MNMLWDVCIFLGFFHVLPLVIASDDNNVFKPWLQESEHIHNGDFLNPKYIKDRLSNATHVLDHEVAEVMGIRFFGSTWCPWHSKEDPDSVVMTQEKPGLAMAWRKWKESQEKSTGKAASHERFNEMPDNIDVLLTHGAPRGILDRMEDTSHSYGSSQVLKTAIQKKRPRVHLFGHIHEQRGYWFRAPDGSFRGEVEYRPAGCGQWPTFKAPASDYPCDLIANTALKNHNGLDQAGSCLVAPARLILACGSEGNWSFSLGSEQISRHVQNNGPGYRSAVRVPSTPAAAVGSRNMHISPHSSGVSPALGFADHHQPLKSKHVQDPRQVASGSRDLHIHPQASHSDDRGPGCRLAIQVRSPTCAAAGGSQDLHMHPQSNGFSPALGFADHHQPLKSNNAQDPRQVAGGSRDLLTHQGSCFSPTLGFGDPGQPLKPNHAQNAMPIAGGSRSLQSVHLPGGSEPQTLSSSYQRWLAEDDVLFG